MQQGSRCHVPALRFAPRVRRITIAIDDLIV
jgi:hypothetical protein